MGGLFEAEVSFFRLPKEASPKTVPPVFDGPHWGSYTLRTTRATPVTLTGLHLRQSLQSQPPPPCEQKHGESVGGMRWSAVTAFLFVFWGRELGDGWFV